MYRHLFVFAFAFTLLGCGSNSPSAQDFSSQSTDASPVESIQNEPSQPMAAVPEEPRETPIEKEIIVDQNQMPEMEKESECSTPNSSCSPTSDSQTVTREIHIQAQRFEFTPSVIVLKKGQPVHITVEDLDTKHGIISAGLGIERTHDITFTPDKIGEFEFDCANYCGGGHQEMKGKFIVQE